MKLVFKTEVILCQPTMSYKKMDLTRSSNQRDALWVVGLWGVATTNGILLKQSRDHNHAPYIGDMSSCC